MLSFFFLVFIGVLFSMIRSRFHLPWVVALIIGGVIAGPHALNLVTVTPSIAFFGEVGLIFLMFMAGLETRLSAFDGFRSRLLLLSFVNGALPFMAGALVAHLFGYDLLPTFLIGIIFMSSSIAVVIPSLESRGLLHTRLGQSVVTTSVIQDIASLILLSFALQSIEPVSRLPPYFFFPLVALFVIGMRYFLPKIESFILSKAKDSHEDFQLQFRSTFLILLGTVIMFEFLGLHPIIGGFFAGFVLSETITHPNLKEKIRTISYGIFVPIFFVTVGLRTDITVFADVALGLPLVSAILLTSVCSKLISGWVGARMVGFPSDQALLFSVSSVAQLSTTLAVTFAAYNFNLIDEMLVTALVTLSVVTAIISPTLMDLLGARIKSSLSMTDRLRARKTAVTSPGKLALDP